MAGFDYSGIQAIADTVLRQFGGADDGDRITYKHKTGESRNASTGAITPTYSSHALAAVVTQFSPTEIDGVRVLAKDKRVVISGLEIENAAVVPNVAGRVVIEGEEFGIVPPVVVNRPAVGGIILSVALQLRA